MKMSFVKNAFAALALIGGTMFTSCTQEDLSTTFTPGPATVTIEANVYNALTGEDVTSKATITGAGTLSYADGVTAGTQVTVSATLGTLTNSEKVTLGTLKKGGTAYYHVNIILTGDEYELVTTDETQSVSTVIDPNKTTHGHSMSHNGVEYYENATEYFMPVTVSFEFPRNTVITIPTKDEKALSSDAVAKLDAIYNEMAVSKTTSESYTYTASAWSLSRPTVTYTVKTTTYAYTSKATGTVVYKAVATETYNSYATDYEEIAHPNHASHYVAHHATGHSEDYGHGENNCGGGIVVAD